MYDEDSKDISLFNPQGDILIDDDRDHVAYCRSIGKHGILVKPFTLESRNRWYEDVDEIRRQIECT